MGRMAVVIVNWNTRALLERCLRSVLAAAADEIVVVDTGSSDGSVGMVRQGFPSVRVELLASNPGYGAGCNAGVRATRAEYVLLLNSDTILPPDALTRLTEVLDREARAAVAGPRILNPDGSPQRSTYPFPGPLARLLVHEPFASVVHLVPALRARYVGRWRENLIRRVPWVLGAAFAIRRTAFDEAGGFDESYEMYFEEVDLCRRLRARGWATLFAPVTDVVHEGGASTKQRRSDMLARFELSLLRFHRRHDRGLARGAGVGIVRGLAAARYLRDSLRYRLVSDPRRKATLAADIAAWQTVMRDRPGR